MSKVTQGSLILLAIVFVGLGGYYLFIAPDPSPQASTLATDEGSGGDATTDGVDAFDAIDLTNLDATTAGSAPIPNDVFDATPGTAVTEAGTPGAIDLTGSGVATAAGLSLPPTATTNTAPAATTNTAPTITTPAAPTFTTPAAPVQVTHTVKDGETLSAIARHYYGPKGDWNVIAAANPGLDPKRLKIGATIKIPTVDGTPSQGTGSAASAALTAGGTGYTVVEGDTLSGISQKVYGSQKHWEAIYEANRSTIGSDPAALKIGMKLTIPAKP